MRVRTRALGVYVHPIQFNEPQNPFPQGGMGGPRGLRTYAFPIRFNEPQNPFGAPGLSAAPRGLGVYAGARFNEPQNPFPQNGAGGLGCLGCLGDASSGLNLSSVTSGLSSAWDTISSYQIAGIPAVWLVAGAGLLLLLMTRNTGRALSQRSGRLSARARMIADRARYLKSRAQLKGE